jgi:hypothetical protein
VEVRYSEGLAIHTDPESCAGIREGVGEALTWRSGAEQTKTERRSLDADDPLRTEAAPPPAMVGPMGGVFPIVGAVAVEMFGAADSAGPLSPACVPIRFKLEGG